MNGKLLELLDQKNNSPELTQYDKARKSQNSYKFSNFYDEINMNKDGSPFERARDILPQYNKSNEIVTTIPTDRTSGLVTSSFTPLRSNGEMRK